MQRHHRHRERIGRQLQEAQARDLGATRFWQWRKRRRIRAAYAEDAVFWDAELGRIGRALLTRKALAPFRRAYKGIHSESERLRMAERTLRAIRREEREREERANKGWRVRVETDRTAA